LGFVRIPNDVFVATAIGQFFKWQPLFFERIGDCVERIAVELNRKI